MPTPPLDLSHLSASLAQFKGQSLSALFDRTASVGPSGRSANVLLDSPFAPAAPGGTGASPAFSSVLAQFKASLLPAALPTSTTPTALDAAGSFSKPGQNMVTVLNRVEVTFKAQYAELGEMRKSLVQAQEAAQKLNGLNLQSTAPQLKDALDAFVANYNQGVARFAPAVDKGGVLEGSWEAARARFATERDISYIMNGSEIGLKGGLAALGIRTDPATKLASIDHAQLDRALAKNKDNVVGAITSFATTFVATVGCLNAPGHAQGRQMANLDRAVHWIHDNRASVQKEFGPGAAATPNAAFAKAAALYDSMGSRGQATVFPVGV